MVTDTTSNDHKEHPMPRIRHRRPRPMVHTVLGGVVSGITRTLLDWLLQHLTP